MTSHEVAHLAHVENDVVLARSQLHGISENAPRDSGSQSALGDRVDVLPEQILQIHEQTAEIEQVAIGVKVDQEVHIARFGVITTSNRAEHPISRGTTVASDLDALATPSAQLGHRRADHRAKAT